MSRKGRIKLQLRLFRRRLKDYISMDHFRFSGKRRNAPDMQHCLRLQQEIKASPTLAHKLYNLRLAASLIGPHVMMPGAIFSFWKAVGRPDNRFKPGRAIIGGQVKEESGGGLCQLSGSLYHLSLIAGIRVLERHNHSVDIYTEETRFTPLGTDATVVYGYKDLRIQNNYPFPLQFRFRIQEDLLELELWSSEKIGVQELNFDIVRQADHVRVRVTGAQQQVLNQSVYRLLPAKPAI